MVSKYFIFLEKKQKPSCMKANKIIIPILLGVGLVVLWEIIFSLLIMLLWNWLVPDIFGLIKISFWQAVGLRLLAGYLFRHGGSLTKIIQKK